MYVTKKRLHCSFCGKHHTAVSHLIAGLGEYICSECIGQIGDEMSTNPRFEDTTNTSLKCSFCDKRQLSVKNLIAALSPGACICSECVDSCKEVIAQS